MPYLDSLKTMSSTHPESILPPSVVLAPIQWSLIEEIQQTNTREPPPPTCPLSKLFVPTDLHHLVMQWTHESPGSGHPGIRCTTQLLRHKFWWPSLTVDAEGWSRPVSPVLNPAPATNCQKGCLSPYLSHVGPGPTYLQISSQTFLSPKGILQSWS